MNNERYNQIIDDAYKNYLDNFVPPVCPPNLDVQPSFYEPVSKEMFIKSIQERNSRGDEFAKKWGLKIEERELSLEERLKIADKFNPLIREDCLTKTHHPDETDELKLVYRHEWLDSLGPNVVPQRKLITLTYNNKKIESYE